MEDWRTILPNNYLKDTSDDYWKTRGFHPVVKEQNEKHASALYGDCVHMAIVELHDNKSGNIIHESEPPYKICVYVSEHRHKVSNPICYQSLSFIKGDVVDFLKYARTMFYPTHKEGLKRFLKKRYE
jgi:hypothetical protein